MTTKKLVGLAARDYLDTHSTITEVLTALNEGLVEMQDVTHKFGASITPERKGILIAFPFILSNGEKIMYDLIFSRDISNGILNDGYGSGKWGAAL